MFRRVMTLGVCMCLLVTMTTGCGLIDLNKIREKLHFGGEETVTENTQNTVAPTEYVPETTISTPETEPAEATKSTEATEPAETTKPSEKPTEPPKARDAWKDAYLEYIESIDYMEKAQCDYRLVYVDADRIPELFISGDCEAAGSTVCAYKNGKVVTAQLRRIGGAAYIPESGLVYNCNGNMGYYTTEIYRLSTKGFSLIFYGEEEETYEEAFDVNGEVDYITTSEFYLYEGTKATEVSEEEYYAAQEKVFDFSASEDLYYYDDSRMYSYKGIRQLIKEW